MIPLDRGARWDGTQLSTGRREFDARTERLDATKLRALTSVECLRRRGAPACAGAARRPGT